MAPEFQNEKYGNGIVEAVKAIEYEIGFNDNYDGAEKLKKKDSEKELTKGEKLAILLFDYWQSFSESVLVKVVVGN